jgi:multisubunit Na+/H+ antiporter MnhB subunit
MMGMSLIVKTIARLVATFITIYGIYVVLYGHLSPGGGFAGGVIIAAGLILVLLAFGREDTMRLLSHSAVMRWESGGALAFLCLAVLGFLAGAFLVNFLEPGQPFALDSAGTLPLLNMAIAAKVGAGLFGVFLALAVFRPDARKEDRP